MKTKFTLLTIMLALIGLSVNAQSEKCATMKSLEQRIAKDPSVLTRMEQSEVRTQNWIATHSQIKKGQHVITIPVVVHVLWNDPVENITNAQIQSQIDVLNEDFRLLNFDSLPPSHPFWIYTADAEIEFCLASRDPNGNATNGITRTYTDSISFVADGNEKFTATGGKDNWDPTKYLNIWVCNLDGSGGTLGYATFPSDLVAYPDEDGVVINYTAFGYIGTATAPNDLGRTGTHEVGHWLNLRHIWGDEACGDDFCADTPEHEGNNYGCPTFPHRPYNNCIPGTYENGEMYMNYMDYVDDYCMVMFTNDQADRMDAALFGLRAGLLTSLGCGSTVGINEVLLENTFNIYPNPSSGNFTITTNELGPDNISISVYDLLGSRIQKIENIKSFPFKMDLNELSNGIYFFNINSGNKSVTKRLIISK